MTMTQSWTEELVDMGASKARVLKGGSGPPLLVLHGSGGNPGWMEYHQELSQHFTVYAPSHPGYDGADRADWVRTVTDVSHFHLGLVRTLGLGQVTIIGFSLGGWIAAEMAAMCPDRVKGMVLVSAVGIKPQVGEIAELLMVSPEQTRALAFYDLSKAPTQEDIPQEQQEALWRNREMTSRLCWKPYMHNPNLPEYLKLVRVPTLIVWGRQDGVVPLNAGEIYHEVLEGSSLHVIEECGHAPEIEKPREFLDVTLSFLSRL